MYPNPVCKSLSQLFERANELSYDNFASEHASLRQDMLKIPALRAHFDKEDNHNIMHFATAAWDTLISMHSHGLPLPKEIDDAFIARVSQVAAIEHLNAAVKPLALTRVEIGNFAHELIGNIVHAVETDRGALSDRQPSPKMGIYSGHDSTLGPLLPSTQAPIEFMWPPYASSMRIELLKDTKTPCPATLPHWAGKLTDFSTDMAAALPESRVRPVNVPSSLYHWPPGRSGTAGSLNPRATRDYYVRVWYNDRTIQLPACRDPGAHHAKLGPAVCTLDGFFKQIARFAASDAEAHRECNLVSSIE
ncbi:hypothetical protein GGH92_009455 [Coemansia sp. RSA 2673]|nr:hypothetical protein GGH92_009455 [Coemansia sp. RSA 2673]